MLRLIITAIALCLSTVCLSQSLNSAERFFTDPDLVTAKLNPQGSAIAAIDYHQGSQRLVIINVLKNLSGKSAKAKRKVLLDVEKFTEKEASLRSINWVDNQHIAVTFSQLKKGIKDLVDTRRSNYLLIIKLPSEENTEVEIYSVRTRGALVHSLPNESDVMLFAKRGSYSKVYKIKVSLLNKYQQKSSKLTKTDGGQFIKANEVAFIKGYAVRWFIDRSGEVVAVLNYDKNQNMVLNALEEDNKTTALKTWTSEELSESDSEESQPMIVPIALAENENSFYCLDYGEEEQRSVYKVDYSTDKQTLVYESDSYRIIDIFRSRETNSLIGVSVLKDGDIRTVYLHSPDQPLDTQKGIQLEQRKAGDYKVVVSESTDQNIRLVYSESHNQSGQYALLDKRNSNHQADAIGGVFPSLDKALASKLVQGNVHVEGLDIPYLLSLPTGKAIKSKTHPLLVMPHGGPIGVFDSAFFDPSIQFLNANGYAVLQVNFRGSSGHSQALKEAGKKQWGKLILNDIHQVTKEVVQRADINSSKVCLFGMSYGGYASTMLLIQYPDVYRCAVNVSGVSDINLYLNSPYLTSRQIAWTREYVGDPLHSYDELKSQSPVYNVGKLIRPLLIMHGEKDKIVQVEQAHRLRKALDVYERPYEWKLFPDMGHSFDEKKQAIELFSTALEFIEKNIAESVVR